MIQHIVERFIIHFFCAYGLVAGIWFLLNWLRRKKACAPWMPQTYMGLLIESALLICLVIFTREPYDVAVVGDWWGKSYFDFASWILGCGTSVWGHYRMFYIVKRWPD